MKPMPPAGSVALHQGQDGWANIWCAVLAEGVAGCALWRRLARVRRCCCRSCRWQTIDYIVSGRFQELQMLAFQRELLLYQLGFAPDAIRIGARKRPDLLELQLKHIQPNRAHQAL